tara:strand:- start:298 stop:828 length:531 start_codon:yes stop_codon:yes gene_type:complete
MAFKMNRPSKMAKYRKSTINKYGKAEMDSGVYYNGKMGPMQMHSPSALKQMEEEAPAEGGGMEDMMAMMGGAEAGAPPAEKKPTSEDGESKTIPGQDIIKGEGEESGEFWFDTGGDDQIYIEDPDGIVAANTTGDYVDDVDFLYEQTEDGYYKVTGVADVSEGSEFEEGVPGTEPQ